MVFLDPICPEYPEFTEGLVGLIQFLLELVAFYLLQRQYHILPIQVLVSKKPSECSKFINTSFYA